MEGMSIPTTTVSELPDDAVLVDVREADEWAAGHAPNAIHIPLAELPARIDELPETDDTVAIVCRMGGRSARAVQWPKSPLGPGLTHCRHWNFPRSCPLGAVSL